jgi:hypothetical protein
MLVFQTTQTLRVIHRSQADALGLTDTCRGAVGEDWLCAGSDTGAAEVFEVRPLSSLEWAEVRGLDGADQSLAIVTKGLKGINGGMPNLSADLSWGAIHAIAALVTAVTVGPLAPRQPAA